jgi:hypothetical protein
VDWDDDSGDGLGFTLNGSAALVFTDNGSNSFVIVLDTSGNDCWVDILVLNRNQLSENIGLSVRGLRYIKRSRIE